MEKILHAYKNELRLTGISTKSITSYGVVINEFLAWFFQEHSEKEFEHVGVQHAKEFKEYLMDEKGNCLKTIKRKINTIAQFGDYLISVGYIKTNPFNNPQIKKMKLPKRLPRYFTIEQYKTLLQHVEGQHRNRNVLIIELYANTGMRLTELSNLNVGDIKDGFIKVLGKGNKERIVYLNDVMNAKLAEYILSLGETNPSDPLFRSNRNTRLTEHMIKKMISKAEKSAGLSTGVHILRHTYATSMMNVEGVTMRHLQDLLGHADISSTAIYTHCLDAQMKKVANGNPLSQISV